VKWLAVLRLVVCLAVVLGITTGCDDGDEAYPDPSGSGILTGRWATANDGYRWSVSHEGPSVTIHSELPGFKQGPSHGKYSGMYDESSRILTVDENLGTYKLSADNNVLVHLTDDSGHPTHDGSMVRQ
jgi:hypothetical protein